MSADHGDISFACAADGDACMVTVMVDDDGNVTATSTGGTVTAMNSEAFDTRLAMYVEMATEAAATKATAIRAEAAQASDADAGLGGSAVTATGNDEGAYNLVIEYGSTGIRVEGATDADDEMFMVAEDFGDGRTMLTRTMDADMDGNVMTEVAIVATDIEAPTPTAFAMVHTLDVNTDTTNDNPTVTNEALNVVTANVAQIMSSGFPPALQGR